MSETNTESRVAAILEAARARDPDQNEFFQAVDEMVESLSPLFAAKPEYVDVLERMLEPERVVSFRVAWADDEGKQHVNRGWRVVMNTALGPGKGGLRFHPTVTLSVLKFLAFEQTAKNALTGLPLGGAKGGSDFNPRGRSDAEIMRFCQAFMTELARHIGPDTDIPAGDIGVGAREIGYLFGQYKRIVHRFDGALTGKGVGWGGSAGRTEATGYGLVYFATHAVESFEGAAVLVSGSGNVALHAAKKLASLGANVLTVSDSGGYIHEPNGLTDDQIAALFQLKTVERGRLADFALSPDGEYVADAKPWGVACDYAFPCATQNELDADDARTLIDNGAKGVFEGANMPTTSDAIAVIKDAGILYSPGKASNAGGVGVSGLEMSQNAEHLYWTAADVDNKLQDMMARIHNMCTTAAAEYGVEGDLQAGANLAGFEMVARAMLAQGLF